MQKEYFIVNKKKCKRTLLYIDHIIVATSVFNDVRYCRFKIYFLQKNT